MKTFRWKIDTSFTKEVIEITPQQLFINHFYGALNTSYKDGLGMEYQRRVFKISDKVEKSTEDTVQLEDAEFDLLQECFERAKCPPALVKIWVQIHDAIEEAKK